MIKVNELVQLIKSWWDARELVPLMIWGPPGIGKSTQVIQAAKSLGVGIVDVRVSLLEPIDLMGLPSIHNGRTVWNTPEFLPSGESTGILFLDELNLGTRDILKSLYQLVLDRRIGKYELPKGWKIIAAGNRSVDGAGVTPLPAPLLNRLIHIEVENNLDQWIAYMGEKVHPYVAAYLKWRPDAFCVPVPATGESGFPTPRSWSQVCSVLRGKDTNPYCWQMVEGLVSKQICTELKQFVQVGEKCNPHELVRNPESFESLERSLLFAAIAAVAAAEDIPLETRVKFFRHISPEFGVLGVKLIFSKHGVSILKLEEIKKWAGEVKDLLLP